MFDTRPFVNQAAANQSAPAPTMNAVPPTTQATMNQAVRPNPPMATPGYNGTSTSSGTLPGMKPFMQQNGVGAPAGRQPRPGNGFA